MKKTIWVNTIVHNEENFIWFAIMSVIDYLDKMVIYDTDSTDQTVEIIEKIIKIKKNKIIFRKVGGVDEEEFTKMRQTMLNQSKGDWILILDGDEIWWEGSIKKVISEINKRGNDVEGIVVPMVVPVGDIYHIQDQAAGKYKLLGKTGNFSLKAFSKNIPGLHVDWPYGKEGFFDEQNNLIQERKKIIFIDAPLLHVTHLKRSNEKRTYEKFKYELGESVSNNFKFPEILYMDYPKNITSPWNKLIGAKLLKAKLLTPLRKFKRGIV